MQDSDILLQQVSVSGITEVSELAKIVWENYYPNVIGQKQVDYMLETNYSYDSLLDQMLNKGHVFYFVISDNKNIGFLSVAEDEQNAWRLNKFYILTNFGSKGIGTRTLDNLKKIIQPKKLSLTVNRNNYKAINFYFKNDFRIVAVAEFDIGNGFFMDDFVMVWNAN